MVMIYLRDFQLTVSDTEPLVPLLSEFDYYFVITFWPVTAGEKENLSSVVAHLRPSDLLFAKPINGFDLWSIGFHLRRTTGTEVTEQLAQLAKLLQSLTQLAGDKKLAGQDIGIYIHHLSKGRGQASDILSEIGKVTTHTLTSNKFGNLSYPREGPEITHILTDKKDEEMLSVPAAHLSSNEMIYEFGEGECSKQRSLDAINALRSLWDAPCQIHDAPNRDACSAEFWLESGTVATVGRYDSIEKMNICASVGTYPKLGSLVMQFYDEDKRELPILLFEDTIATGELPASYPTFEHKVKVLPLPRIEPFARLRHVLISFSRR